MSRCVRHILAAVVTCLVTSIAAPRMVCAQESLSSQSASAMQHLRLRMSEVDKGRFPTARPHFEAAVAADPSWGYAHLQLSTRAARAADRGDAGARRAGADAASLVNIGLSSQQLEDGFTSMFNGKDLSGWDGATEFWTVQDGAIVGETKRTSQQTIFLYWTGGEPADFEMRCRFRISGTEANSGIQIRSQRVPEWDALGYQADFDVSGYSVGNLYLFNRKPLATFAQRGDSVRIDSSGNRTVSNFATPAKLLDAYKRGDWNDYWIIAKGRQVTVLLNGVLMTKVEDHEQEYFSPKGIIALQLHSGEPMRVEFKDLRIRQY